ncbi:Na+/H+ antiporter subunit E [Dietzia cinnamea]|uniref:Multisubunit sodium/proton antiporter MrpE subunit n=1 Tax=Dietzia cinnamea TaxID=321318 RepID=A0A4R3ZWM0_9ACTN|nr:Na+/H+ antiporter subunit E [Dietzia cinnamea]TCW25078.1 multisubunit sodium/proton antiporter MrpE subunit [Dietzia cinnamea]
MGRKPSPDLRVLGARVFMTLWLTFAWVLLWGTVEIGTIVSGLLVATLVMVVLPLPRVPVEGLLRPLSTAWLVLVVAFYLIRSSLVVAWLSIRPKPPPRSAVLRAPMRLKSDFTLALAVNTLNLLPGGIVVRVDPVARYVYVHVLDAGTDEAVEQFRRQTAHVEKLYLRAFERDEDWKPSPEHYSAPADSAPSAASTVAPAEPVDPAGDTDPADPDADRAAGPDNPAGPDGDEKKPFDPTTEEEGPW